MFPKEDLGVIRVFWNALQEAGTLVPVLGFSTLMPLSMDSNSLEASVEQTFESWQRMSCKLLSFCRKPLLTTRCEFLVESRISCRYVVGG